MDQPIIDFALDLLKAYNADPYREFEARFIYASFHRPVLGSWFRPENRPAFDLRLDPHEGTLGFPHNYVLTPEPLTEKDLYDYQLVEAKQPEPLDLDAMEAFLEGRLIDLAEHNKSEMLVLGFDADYAARYAAAYVFAQILKAERRIKALREMGYHGYDTIYDEFHRALRKESPVTILQTWRGRDRLFQDATFLIENGRLSD